MKRLSEMDWYSIVSTVLGDASVDAENFASELKVEKVVDKR